MTIANDLKPVKVRFEHIEGKLGKMLMETFVENGWIAKTDTGHKHFHITGTGQQEFTKLGLDLTKLTRKEWEYDRTI
jgi:hypothetical protein